MKSFIAFASFFAVAAAQTFPFFGAPAPGATLHAGQNVTVQIIVPVDTSAEAGVDEVALVIGIVACGTSPCPAASADVGDVLFIGKYEGTGSIGSDGLHSFQNFTVTIPPQISGSASIQAQHITISTPPGHGFPGTDSESLAVNVVSGSSSPSGPSTSLNIHPNGDNTKCVGIQKGVYADGTPVDIFDCNASVTQKWQWNGDSLTSTNPTDGSQWCLDAGVNSAWANGVQMKIWQCLPNLPQQTWTPDTSSGNIKLTTANFCLDLTNGDKTNSNILQIWQCGGGNPNQIWSVTSV